MDAVILALLLACGPNCAGQGSALQPTCWATTPCADSTQDLDTYALCRPDQTGSIEWEPAAPAARVEDEDRVGGVLFCRCAR